MGLVNAVRFLTILPISIKKKITERDLGRAAAWFPAVGVLLGGLLFLVFRVFSFFLSSLTVNAFVLVFWVFLTRGFHLDGLADTADGIGGGANREERLAIMKDSRIGAFGVLVLISLLLLKFTLLGELEGRFYLGALILAAASGRWMIVLAIFSFPSAKKGGMGQRFKKHCRITEIIIATITVLVCAYFTQGLWGIAILLGTGAVVMAAAFALANTLGGLTGDTYGALCEIGEVVSLLGINLLLGLT
ncbi:MAG: adenosylcobinamide-GDP ribazoletransferase [Spirochaeta sp.]|nr:adenosylcobinamide-GDP ribazoletransferase [Spirochaeta sp.]